MDQAFARAEIGVAQAGRHDSDQGLAALRARPRPPRAGTAREWRPAPLRWPSAFGFSPLGAGGDCRARLAQRGVRVVGVDPAQLGVQIREQRVARGDRGAVGEVHQVGVPPRKRCTVTTRGAGARGVAPRRGCQIWACRLGQAVGQRDRVLDRLVRALALVGTIA